MRADNSRHIIAADRGDTNSPFESDPSAEDSRRRRQTRHLRVRRTIGRSVQILALRPTRHPRRDRAAPRCLSPSAHRRDPGPPARELQAVLRLGEVLRSHAPAGYPGLTGPAGNAAHSASALADPAELLTDNEIDLRPRVAFTLLLLYGQPLSRIFRLTIDDIIPTSEEGVSIRFGEPPTPVPEPFAGLVLDLIDQRTNMRTATNPNARRLFPGRRAGQPLRPETLGKQSAKTGVPTITGRVSALRQLVLQAIFDRIMYGMGCVAAVTPTWIRLFPLNVTPPSAAGQTGGLIGPGVVVVTSTTGSVRRPGSTTPVAH